MAQLPPKLLLIVLICSAVINLLAQNQVIKVPGHAISTNTTYGTVLQTTIANSSQDTTVIFRPLLEYPQLDSLAQNHTAYLLSQATGNSLAEKKWEVVKTEYTFIKSIYRSNGLLIASEQGCDEPDSLNNAMYGPNAWLGIWYSQCRNHWELFANDLMATGLFNATDSFTTISFQAKHTLGQIYMPDGWYVFDCDPGEPAGISKGDIWDLMRNHAAISSYRYQSFWGDSILLCPYLPMQAYYELLDSNILEAHAFVPINGPQQISNNWKLPAGARLNWKFNTGLLIDTTLSAGNQAHEVFRKQLGNYAITGTANYIDSAFRAISALTNLTKDSLQALYIKNQLLFYGGNHWSPAYTSILPILELDLETGYDTLFIGRDVALPIVITDVYTTKPVVLGNNVVVEDSMHFKNWSTFQAQVAPSITYRNFQFLNEGFISPYAQVKIFGAFNPMAYNFYKGFDIEQVSGGTLQITGDSTLQSAGPTTNFTAVANKKNDALYIYPNPSRGYLNVIASEAFTIYDIYGNLIDIISTTGNTQHIQTGLKAGIYFLKSETTVKKVVIQ